MKPFKSIIFLVVPLIFGISCKKFLDVEPKGIIIAKTVNDYESILNNGNNMTNPFGANVGILQTTDDLTQPDFSIQNISSADVNLYFWRTYINISADRPPDVWGDFYNSIANLNAVTEGVLTATAGTMQKKKQIYAEAMLNKSFVYFHLLAFFSPAYDQATAATNFGVPYITSTDVSQPKPVRPSLQKSYDQMISDVVTAIPDLPETNINNARATKNIAYGLLTRIYMSMGDYLNAEKYADLVLTSGKAVIVNYNDYIGGSLPPTNGNAEELFLRYSNNLPCRYSKDLLLNYEVNKDLRIRFFAVREADDSYTYGNTAYKPNRGITYAEIYLDKAECLARRGNIDEALKIVNTDIRKNRFTTADYTALSASTRAEAVDAVLTERRRELAFKGIRWSDMKRLDKEGKMREVQRLAADGTTILATLAPGSAGYTFQIPLSVQFFNPGMPLNK